MSDPKDSPESAPEFGQIIEPDPTPAPTPRKPKGPSIKRETIADAEPEDSKPPLDETVEGGKYIVSGRFVDAEGKDLGEAKGFK